MAAKLKGLGNIQIEPVRNDQLLEKAPHNQLGAKAHPFVIKPVFLRKLHTQLIVSGNRSLQDMGEVQYIQQILKEVLLR